MKKVRMRKKSKNPKYIAIGFVLFIFIALLLFASYVPQEGTQYNADSVLTDINGQSFRLGDFRGKVVILYFMAVWCEPCRVETAILTGIWQKYEGRIVIISIDIAPWESNEDLRAFSEDFPGATWIWCRDTSNLAQTHKITILPTLVVIDQDGKLVSKHVGLRDPSALISEIDSLIS